MKSIISFSNETRKKLEAQQQIALQLNNGYVYRVVQALRFIGDKECDFSFSEIAKFVNVTPRTIYNWFSGFVTGGFSWLLRERFKGRGRKSRLSQKQRDELYDMIVAGPESNGFDSGIWNSAMIAELIMLRFGVKYAPRYLSRLLRKIKLSYQKAKFISDRCDEQEYIDARKKWVDETWPNLLEEARKTNAIILFGDEVSFAMWGSLARTWAPRGKQPLVKTKGCRKGLKMFGAIEFESGEFHYMESLTYTITQKSLKQYQEADLSKDLLNHLKTLKNEKFSTKECFIHALRNIIGEEAIKNEPLFLQHAETAGKFNGENYVKFLKQLIEESSSPIILIEDGAPYHRSRVVKEFVATQSKKLRIEGLPAFSPDYNPIEKLWKNTKRDATHCKYFETFEKLRESVLTTFEKYLKDAAQVICVMKKLRVDAEVADSI